MLHVAASSLKKRVPKLRSNLPAKEKEKRKASKEATSNGELECNPARGLPALAKDGPVPLPPAVLHASHHLILIYRQRQASAHQPMHRHLSGVRTSGFFMVYLDTDRSTRPRATHGPFVLLLQYKIKLLLEAVARRQVMVGLD
jgi:hypothetical protein